MCARLSAVLLVGLGIAGLAAVEGVRTWRAESLADNCCS
jgi:hypothetical protein